MGVLLLLESNLIPQLGEAKTKNLANQSPEWGRQEAINSAKVRRRLSLRCFTEQAMTLKKRMIAVLVAPLLIIGCTTKETKQLPATTSQETDVVKKDYSLSISTREIADNKIELKIRSNIPGVIEVSASIDLVNQKPDDIYIGKSKKVLVSDQNAVEIIDVSDLPGGDYNAVVTLYPLWGFKDSKSKSLGIGKELSASQLITISGTGKSSESAAKRQEGRQWVMLNVEAGTPWIPAAWESRFGAWDEIPTTTRNPEVIKNYYFKSLDMTIIVNVLKQEIVAYRLERGGL